MPKVYERQTGKLKTGELQITQPTGTLIFTTTRQIQDLTNEKISLKIQRAQGGNVHLATKISLKDFLYATICNSYGRVFCLDGENFTVIANIGLEAAINLKDGEKLIIELEGLISTDYYEIGYVPHWKATNSYLKFENKAVTVGYTDQVIDVAECDVAVIGLVPELNEIGVYVGGVEKRFTPEELQLMQVEDAPMLGTTKEGYVSQYDKNVLTMPTAGVEQLRFYKQSEGIVTITLMQRDEIIPATSAGGYPLKMR